MAINILLVDDDAEVVSTTGDLLQRKGYKVHTAFSAEEALELLKNVRPNIIITDYRLPQMNGDVLTDKLKSQPDLSDIPILMCTAQVTLTQPLGGNPRLRKPDGYLVKPFTSKQLLDQIVLLTSR